MGSSCNIICRTYVLLIKAMNKTNQVFLLVYSVLATLFLIYVFLFMRGNPGSNGIFALRGDLIGAALLCHLPMQCNASLSSCGGTDLLKVFRQYGNGHGAGGTSPGRRFLLDIS